MPVQKRKREEDLSTNVNTVKTRRRVNKMSETQLLVNKARVQFNTANCRLKKKARTTDEYAAANDLEKEIILKRVETRLVEEE